MRVVEFGAKPFRNLVLRILLIKHSLNPVPDSGLLNEFGGSVDVQEEAIIEALYSTGVAWPHVKLVLRDLRLILSIEELRKTTELFVILLIQTVLHDFCDKV